MGPFLYFTGALLLVCSTTYIFILPLYRCYYKLLLFHFYNFEKDISNEIGLGIFELFEKKNGLYSERDLL